MDPLTREDALRSVRKARRSLRVRGLVRGAARGLVAGCVVGLLWTLWRKGAGQEASPIWPAAMVLAGALCGTIRWAIRQRITLAAAAWDLDTRLATRSRLTTLATRPEGSFDAAILKGLELPRRLPSSPYPKEAALVPGALFLLVAAGFLPSADAGEEASVPATIRGHAVVAVQTNSSAETAPDAREIRRIVGALAKGSPPPAADVDVLKEAIRQSGGRPEDRTALREILERARGGDAVAARRLGDALRSRYVRGASGSRNTADSSSGGSDQDPGARKGAAAPSPYPDSADYIRAYRRALSRGLEGK